MKQVKIKDIIQNAIKDNFLMGDIIMICGDRCFESDDFGQVIIHNFTISNNILIMSKELDSEDLDIVYGKSILQKIGNVNNEIEDVIKNIKDLNVPFDDCVEMNDIIEEIELQKNRHSEILIEE